MKILAGTTLRRAAAALMLTGTAALATGAPAQADYKTECQWNQRPDTSYVDHTGAEQVGTNTSWTDYQTVTNAFACLINVDRRKAGLKPVAASPTAETRTDRVGGIARGLLEGYYKAADIGLRMNDWCRGANPCVYYEWGFNYSSAYNVLDFYKGMLNIPAFKAAVSKPLLTDVGVAAVQTTHVYPGYSTYQQRWRLAMGGR